VHSLFLNSCRRLVLYVENKEYDSLQFVSFHSFMLESETIV